MNCMIFLVIVVVVIIVVGVYFLMQGNVIEVEVIQIEILVEFENVDVVVLVIFDMVFGDVNVLIIMIEYVFYICFYCGFFYQNIYLQLKVDYIDMGKVKFVFCEVYFDCFGLWVFMIVCCGGQECFFGIIDLMFKI